MRSDNDFDGNDVVVRYGLIDLTDVIDVIDVFDVIDLNGVIDLTDAIDLTDVLTVVAAPKWERC